MHAARLRTFCLSRPASYSMLMSLTFTGWHGNDCRPLNLKIGLTSIPPHLDPAVSKNTSSLSYHTFQNSRFSHITFVFAYYLDSNSTKAHSDLILILQQTCVSPPSSCPRSSPPSLSRLRPTTALPPPRAQSSPEPQSPTLASRPPPSASRLVSHQLSSRAFRSRS